MLCLIASGCQSESAGLTVTSISNRQAFRQNFTHAYSGRNSNGDIDVVLIDEATEKELATQVPSPSVRHVMHIRIIWQPTRDMKAEVFNAAMHWFVIGNGPQRDILEYSGIGFVGVREEDSVLYLRVKNSVVRPGTAHGGLTDPLGPSRLEGTIVATPNRDVVDKVLGSVHTSLSMTPAPSGARAQ